MPDIVQFALAYGFALGMGMSIGWIVCRVYYKIGKQTKEN